MSAVVFSPKPHTVSSEGLAAMQAYARDRNKSVEDLLAEFVDSFAPVEPRARIVGRDERGPIIEIPDSFVYHPKYAPDGTMILPAAWDDGDVDE